MTPTTPRARAGWTAIALAFAFALAPAPAPGGSALAAADAAAGSADPPATQPAPADERKPRLFGGTAEDFNPTYTPEPRRGIELTDKRGESLPLDAAFTDRHGKTVTIADALKPGKPVILVMGYYECPMLCGLVLNGLADAAQRMKLGLGEDYRVVTISVSPTEDAKDANHRRAEVFRITGMEDPADDWLFLTGRKEPIQRVADAVGFPFKPVPGTDPVQYSHPPALVLVTPEGKVSRYLTGHVFKPEALSVSLQEASDNQIGSVFDQIKYACFVRVDKHGEVAWRARRLMMLGGAVTLAILVAGIGLLFVLGQRPKVDARMDSEGKRPADRADTPGDDDTGGER